MLFASLFCRSKQPPVLARLEPLESRTLMSTTYYVSPAGNDANAGTSASAPWRTLARATRADLAAGDGVLLQGGRTHAGQLTLDSNDWGTPAAPITIGSYGAGRATINAGNGGGIYLYDTQGIHIEDLNIVGAGGATNTASGIEVYSDAAPGLRLLDISVDDVDVSGFGKWGLRLGAWNGNTGFRDVRVTNSAFHDNVSGGIVTYGQSGKPLENVYVAHNRVYDNDGNPNDTTMHSGNGMMLGGLDGAVVERNVAFNNGRLNGSNYGGPVGIWALDSNDVVIQNNESYGNRTGTTKDGGGFDFDGGVTNSVMQYNYSHDNDGPGYLLWQYPGAGPWSNNVMRYNVSENDGRANGHAAIYVGGAANGLDVYNNTVFLTRPATGTPAAMAIHGGNNIRVRNNVFVTSGGLPLVVATGGTNRRFQGNDYYPSGANFRITWNGHNYSSLAEWRAWSGQEMLNGVATGVSVRSRVTFAGGGGTIGDADRLETDLGAYTLRGDSTLINRGLDLRALFGTDVGARDFYGNELPQGGTFDIGANEAIG